MITKLFFAFCVLLISGQVLVSAQVAGEKALSLTVKSAPWNLTIPKDNIVVADRQFKPDGQSAYFLMNDQKNQMTISFFIEPAVKCQDSKACRDMVWKLGNPAWGKPQNIVQSEIDGVSYFEFLIPSYQGQPIKQQNMYLEFVKDGYWIDLHISKVLYKPEEHELFEKIVKSIKFEPKSEKPN